MELNKDSEILDVIQNSLNIYGRDKVRGYRRKAVKWTKEEEALVLLAVSECGRKWHYIKQNYHFPNREWNDIAYRYQYLTTENEAPRRERVKYPWSSDETLTLLRGIEKFGCHWTQIRDWGFPEYRSRNSLQTKATRIVKRFRPNNQKLHVYIDLHPNRVILFYALYPHVMFLRLRRDFPNEMRYYIYDYDSQNVHIYGKQGKLYFRPSKEYEFDHVQKLLKNNTIKIPEKKTTKKAWYSKVLYWGEYVEEEEENAVDSVP